MSTWFCLHVESGREPGAEKRLKREGFEPYLPRCIRASRTGKDKGRARPLWPGYMLLRAHTAPWREVLDVPHVLGVLCLVGPDSPPAELPDSLVADLRKWEGMDGVIVLKSKHLPKFQNGERVRMKWGALQGNEGVIQGEDPRGRVNALFSLLGGQVVVRGIEPEQLEAVA